jgi:hypothetical protein
MTYPINQNYNSYTQGCVSVGNFMNHMPKGYNPVKPQYNCYIPQQQCGVVGGPQRYAPPPAISYGSAYSCYTPGNASYNKSVGMLAAAITGMIYSTPMSGGYMPGQLSTYGASVPYAAWCPPGGGFQPPSYPPFFISQASCNPPQYKKMGMGW